MNWERGDEVVEDQDSSLKKEKTSPQQVSFVEEVHEGLAPE